ncbi:MAG: hypothetical protein Q7U12_13360 [Undibacterium sp.]|nr:hypothetical protein [Undibacterium sp.]
MSPAKMNALMDTLKLTCARQFRFNPRRVAADMRYKGTEGQGNHLVHVFKDVHTHSQIELNTHSMATLREQHGESPHWDEAEKMRYCHTDAEIDAEIAAKQAELEYTRASALYQDHREQLLSHYKDSPHYREGMPTAREAARALVVTLGDAKDPRLSEFAAHMHTSDPEQLSHLLLAPCHIERAAGAAKPA